MATYYGYKEREDPKKSMIDWASITKDITTNLYAEAKRREEEKFTLEQDYVKQLNSLNEYSQGLDPTLNSAMLSYAQNYRDYLLENHKMMKAGVIGVNDSKLAKQGAQDSFTNLNNMVTSLNGEVQKLMEKGGNVNEFLAQFAANTLDFKNQQLLIDQKTGSGSFARLKEDGTIDKNTIVPFAAASQMFQPYNVVDINKLATDATKDLGKLVTADNAYYSLSDIRQNKEYYENWMNTTLDSMTNGKKLIEVASALGYEVGDTASGTTMKANTDGGRVNFELTPEQQKEVREKLRSAIELRIDSEEKRSAPSATDQMVNANRKQQEQVAASLIKYLKTGDEPTGAGILGGKAAENVQGIVIDKEGGTSSVIMKDGKSISMPTKKGEKEVSVGDLFISIAPNLGISNDIADKMAKEQGLFDITLAESYPELIKRGAPFTFVTTENLNLINEAITKAGGPEEAIDVVLRQINAIAGPKGLPSAVVKKNEDGEEIYVIPNENGQDFVLGTVEDPTAVLKRLDVKLGAGKASTASGDSIILGDSQIIKN